jgi:hypothetical protein
MRKLVETTTRLRLSDFRAQHQVQKVAGSTTQQADPRTLGEDEAVPSTRDRCPHFAAPFPMRSLPRASSTTAAPGSGKQVGNDATDCAVHVVVA